MAVSAFLKLTGIEGSSTIKGHEKQIEVVSWNHSFNQPTTAVKSSGGGATVEKANHAHINFTKACDDSTPPLLKHCWSGKYIAEGEITCSRSDGESEVKYLIIKMENVVVADYSISGGEGGIPVEHIALDYAKITYTYLGMGADGTVGGNIPTSHDLRTNVVS